jgi:hypothetical protein
VKSALVTPDVDMTDAETIDVAMIGVDAVDAYVKMNIVDCTRMSEG